ncbi:fatty acid--CoA ligase family protein [Castellaniella sp.]|uniref:class I adenylate-forming enzyme family protein n=1 Tax=Castellaniella sp. TaxID=1955812 RepID=UPI002AFE77A4|nr:fatty acid--CoA ligase family protein [Castellaniella sp.]
MTASLFNLLEAPAAQSARIMGGDGAAFEDGASLRRSSLAISVRLREAGMEAGEPVLVFVANRAIDIAAFFGVWKAGGVVVPVHATASENTQEEIRRQTGARLALDGEVVQHVSDRAPAHREILREAALIIFTSGSTGRPKGVVIGHARMDAKLEVLNRLLRIGAGDAVILPLHLIFIFGIWVSLLTLAQGAQLRLVTKFTPQSMREMLTGCTVFATVPSMMRAMFAEGEVSAPELRAILTGGEALGPLLSAQLTRNLPEAQVFDLYGLTETGSCDFCLRPEDRIAGADSVGHPTEGVRYRIVDALGKPVAAGMPGELVIDTPFGMLGYLDNPELTLQSHFDDHFRTGDLARLRPEGFVEIVGRIKEIISRGGNKIAPAEIEILLMQHDDISQALCAGAPDARLGEAIHAVIVPRHGKTLDPDAVRTWCASRIERFKVPDVIHLVDALPTGPTGKARRAGIRELIDPAQPQT